MRRKRQINPETKQLLAELEDVVHRLGYKLRYEKGNFEGGYCLLKESRLFVINSRSEAEKRIGIIARNLKEIGIDEIFVKPQIREVIEKENAKSIKPEEKKTQDSAQDSAQ